MLSFPCAFLAVLMMSVSAFGAGSMNYKNTVTVKPDGTCVTTTETLMPRKSVEQQVKMMEQMKKRGEFGVVEPDEDEGEGEPAEPKPPVTPEAPKIDDKPIADDELVKRAKEVYGQQHSYLSTYADIKTDSTIEVQGDQVRVITTTTYASIKDLLRYGQAAWSMLGFDEVRVEKDDKGNLRWTFGLSKQMARYRKNLSQQWKATGMKNDFTLVLPGKVLSSTFPNTKEKETSIAIDAQKQETLDALTKLYETGVTIVAEPGGLVVGETLDSKVLQRTAYRARQGDMGSDLPIVDAGPGFLAEPLAITITATHHFPEGTKYTGATEGFEMQNDGAMIQVKLFAPKGRTIRSVSDIRVVKAVDNKGRTLKPAGEEEDVYSSTFMDFSNQAQDSAQMQVRLQVPEPDTETIEEVAAEAVVVTVGKWKETTLTGLKADKDNKLDLSAVLPDAKLIITKLDQKNQRGTLAVRVEGPADVRRLDFQVKIPGSQHSSAHPMQQNEKTENNLTVRTLTLSYYGYDSRGQMSGAPPSLLVRFPEEIKRERVKFTLKALDLF